MKFGGLIHRICRECSRGVASNEHQSFQHKHDLSRAQKFVEDRFSGCTSRPPRILVEIATSEPKTHNLQPITYNL